MQLARGLKLSPKLTVHSWLADETKAGTHLEAS